MATCTVIKPYWSSNASSLCSYIVSQVEQLNTGYRNVLYNVLYKAVQRTICKFQYAHWLLVAMDFAHCFFLAWLCYRLNFRHFLYIYQSDDQWSRAHKMGTKREHAEKPEKCCVSPNCMWFFYQGKIIYFFFFLYVFASFFVLWQKIDCLQYSKPSAKEFSHFKN